MKTYILISAAILAACEQRPSTRQLATECQSDGSSASVQNCNNTLSDGGLLKIPAGTFTWSTGVTIGKKITLQGAGIGQTIIKDNVQSGQFLKATAPARITGIEFRDGGRTNNASAPAGAFQINGSGFRIDHCKFDHIKGQIVSMNGINSLIDHNEFRFCGNCYIAVYNSDYGGVPHGDGSQAAPTQFGSDQFVFIEDNILAHDTGQDYAQLDAFGGARYVVRHNKIINGRIGGHGTEGQRGRGMRAGEVYNNTWENDTIGKVGHARGGIVLYHDNLVKGLTNGIIDLEAHRVSFDSSIWGKANGSNPWDVNQDGVLIHAIDQPGRCQGSLISGGVPPNRPINWNDQITDPCYSWNNKKEDGTPLNFTAGEPNIKPGTHYFNNQPKPGYTPYTYPHPLTDKTPAGSPTVPPETTTTPVPTSTPVPTATPQTPVPSPTRTPLPTAAPTSTAQPTATPAPTITPTPAPSPIVVPAPPTNLSAKVIRGKDVELSWEGTGEYYEIARSTDCVNWNAAVRGIDNPWTDTTTAKRQKYCYQVRACNESCSEWSERVTVNP